MRAKLILLLVFPILLLSFSCEDDDDNNQEEQQEIVLTQENTYYEGDLYRLYLDAEIETTNSLISEVQLDLEQAPNNIELINQLETLNTSLDQLENNVDNQNNAEEAIIGVPRIPRIPPIPPMPCLSGACIPNVFNSIIITQDVQSVVIAIQNQQTQEVIAVAAINEFTPLPEWNNLLSATTIDIQGFTGAITINVARTNVNGQVTKYSVSGNTY